MARITVVGTVLTAKITLFSRAFFTLASCIIST